MKKKLWLPLWILGMALALTGCKKEEESASQPMLEVIEYSNLIGSSATGQLETLMTDAGISKERQHILLEHISQMNSAVNTEGLAADFETAHIYKIAYAPEIMQAEWMSRYPNFPGYNSRITTFCVFGEFLDIPADSPVRDEALALDISALQADGSVLMGEDSLQKFKVLYSAIEMKKAEDTAACVAAVQKDWEERGIKITEEDKVRMITVFFPENDELYIGHTGVIFPVEEKKEEVIYFLEKISFQEPYQLTRFNNRTELSDYLMYKYDTSDGQEGAAPFIMENNQLMEGYRLLPQKVEE